MAVVTIANVRKHALELLLASPVAARYTDALGTNSEYAVLAEITDTALNIDAEICKDICETPGHPYASLFMTLSAAMSSGDEIPEHIGVYGDVHVAITDTNKVYKPSIPAKSREEILQMIANEAFYGGPSRHHYLEANFIYHSGYQASASAKVYYPVFAKTAVCQAHEAYESLEVYGTVATLEKDGGNESFFRKYDGLYQLGRSLIRTGAALIPAQQQLEAMTHKG